VGKDWFHALWSNDAVMLVGGYGTVHMICRDGRRTSSPKLYGISQIDAHGSGSDFRAVVAGRDGKLMTFFEGKWEVAQAPTIGEEDLVGAVIDGHGTTSVAGKQTALYQTAGDTWSIHRYPEQLGEVHSLAQYTDGRIVLGGSRGVYTYFGDTFSAKKLSQSLDGAPKDMWISSDDTLWLVTDSKLARLTKTGEFQTFEPPLFGRLRAISGVSTPAGEVVAVAAQSELALFDGTHFLRMSGNYSFPEDLHLDGANEALYIAHRDGLTHVQFDHPTIVPRAIDVDTICPIPKQLGGTQGAMTGVHSSRTTKAKLSEAKKKSSQGTRDSMPTLRLAFGVAFGQDSEQSPDASFAFDLMAGGTIGVAPKLSVFPEFGYGHSRLREAREDLFLAGVGPLWGNEIAAVGVVPRFALGKSNSQFAIGTRTGLIGSFGMDILAIEVAHQWLRVGGQNLHEGRVMASINILPLFAAVLLAAALGGLSRRRRRSRRWRR